MLSSSPVKVTHALLLLGAQPSPALEWVADWQQVTLGTICPGDWAVPLGLGPASWLPWQPAVSPPP